MTIDECCHNSPSADGGEKLDIIKVSNETVESPSVVLGKRKRTDEGDGAAASNISPLELHLTPFELNLTKRTDPATASTFMPPMADNSVLEKLPPPTHNNGAPASKIIPWELHLMIQGALELRELVKRQKIKRFELKECEDRVRSFVKMLKKLKKLPRDWKYDPDTASTLVPAEPEALEIPPRPHKTVRCCSQVYDPNQKFPKATNVPLNDDERLIWSEFLDGDKAVPALGYVSLRAVDEVKRPLEIENPIVTQIGNFAVAAFNEAVEMYVKKREANNIHDIEIIQCKYLKMKSAYYFYLTIEAIEERKHGVYEAKVDFMLKTSCKTLSHFKLTDCKPHKPPAEEGLIKRKTHPDSWLDSSRIRYTGMKRRLNRSICRGYDYQTPWGTGLP